MLECLLGRGYFRRGFVASVGGECLMRLPSVSVFGRLWKRSPDIFSSSPFTHSPFARKIPARKQAEDRLQAQLSSIERLYQFADKVSRAQGLDEVCDAAVEGIVEIVSAQRAS